MMIRRGAVVLAGLLLTLAGPAAGQKAGVGLQIVPRIGAHLPQSNLTEFRLDSATNIVTRLESSFALGFAVELDLPIPFVNVRANLDYVTGSTSDPFEEQDTSTFALGQTTLLML
ncbi:MAG: hypothetical protein HY561_11760, partial [Gemmatimonadetes bacterium]|nr:hypothetical protein [Gemmatimonadota bacterium]